MKPRDYRKNEIILISWVDILTDSAWLSEEKASKLQPPKCETIGFFLNNGFMKEHPEIEIIRLSHTKQFDQEKERDVTVIPWGCIKDIMVIK